jgi:YD repeat-containing protein
MGSSRESVVGRLRWIAAFVLLLLSCSAVPVLAADEAPMPQQDPTGFTPPTAEEEEIAAAQVPNASDVYEALAEAEREQREREKWLSSPEAVDQREASWRAFADLSAVESEGLLRAVFADQLEVLNSDPGRYLSDARLVRDPAGAGAVVEGEDGGSLLESSVPVRTEDGAGQLAKVDLSLEAIAGGYETRNAIADLRLPDSATGPIEVGEEGFEIAQAGAADSLARRFGDENLFYSEVSLDTDLLVAGTSFGVELFNLLRSRESPEVFRFEIEVPAGAELRSDGRGGAEVTRDEETLMRIPKPWALDAQQTEVPVQLEVDDDAIILHVAHRDGDYAYPALLDPIVEDWVNQGANWYGGSNWAALSNGAWQWTSNNSNILHDICCWEGSHAGLLTIVQDAFYGPEQYGQWSYSTGNEKVFITNAWLIPFNRADNGCGSAQPHDYVGLWNPDGNWIPLQTNRAKDYGNASFGGYGKALVLGQGSGPPGVWLACDRVLYSGGVGIWLNDDWGPGISYAGVPSGSWFGDQEQVAISVSSWDEGLGVQFVKLLNEGNGVVAEEKVNNCTGLYGARCPTSRNSSFNGITGDSFGEGVRNSSVTVSDPTGKVAEKFFTTKVDNSKPEVALEGQLAEATGEVVSFAEAEKPVSEGEDKLSLPIYNLRIEAKDGALTNDKTKRSGVKDIEVWLDGKELEVPWQPLGSCPATSCSMTKTYPLDLTEIEAAGKHNLEVIAKDFVGEEKKRNIEFEYFPATGMKDEYVMHYFPLPDGQGSEDEEEHSARPELAVNVMNGNLVFRERDIDVEGSAAVDLEVERFYNSQLPATEDTEWGDGWTLAQTPELKPEEGASPQEAELLDTSGALEEEIELPTGAGEETFDSALQATLTKKESGGYELTDETGESATSVAFDATGQTEARLTEGAAKVDYAYEGGELAEIAVKDPGSAGNPTAPPEEEAEEEAGEAPAYSSSFGSNGSGDGQLKSPGDVALAAQGDLWVVDKSNNRVQKFSAEGEFISKFGAYGTGNGQFNRPTAIAVAADGDLLVTDAGNGRVQRFSSAGAYISQFGSKGSGNGKFTGAGPEGIAIGQEGEIYVSDTYAGRVQKFTSGGTFIESIGSKGSGEGQIGEPTGIDIDAGGNLWVADWQNNRVEVFDEEGNFLDQFGSTGTGEGQFNRPDALDIDEAGNVWVGDQNNGRVQRFDLAAQYVDQFGAKGSGEGQFSFAYPMGIAASDGHIWVTDVNNHRVQEWIVPEELTTYTDVIYADAFGESGVEPGQLSYPSGVELDVEGDLWVADRNNHRVQRFAPDGELVSQLGSLGTEDGQLKYPSDIAVTGEGEILVLDRGNARVQLFSAAGQFLDKFGSKGTGDGQFTSPFNILGPEGIAIAPSGEIWVTDTYAGRVQRFDPEGQFIEVVGSKGEAEGQLGRPTGIDIGPDGRVWVADSQYNRVSVFDEEGEFLFRFGSTGTGEGQFTYPEAVEVDAKGNVWVGERGNDRVQLFDAEGTYVLPFGEAGSGEAQFNLGAPMGIASDGAGGIWLTDVDNHRLQKWVAGNYVPDESEVLPEDDPRVDVETPGGLVASVAGAEAGTHEYAHEGDLLVAHDGPEGETVYEYDAEDRLSKVTLPNGTWAEIDYEATVARVQEVRVSIEGGAVKTTTFEYEDDPQRRTKVIPSDAPHLVYDIGDDGSVLKWWNVKEPPELDLGGALYDNREKDGFFWEGARKLEADAESAEGIASIDIIANGDTLVDEQKCPKPEVIECIKEESEWIAESDLHAPGHLQLEVIATDRLGESTSERFWVDVPEPQPLAAGTPVPPRFRDIAGFREEYGLEVVFPVANETELNERIFDLIKAWHEPNTPAGQVARASMERWGVPLRPADVAELDYREWFYNVNAEKIDQWVEATSPGGYAGYYMDHPAGGVMHIGFIDNQEEELESLKTSMSLEAEERLQVYPTTPTASYLTVRATAQSVLGAIESNSTLASLVVSVEDDEAGKATRVGTPNVAQVESILDQMLGANAPVAVEYEAGGGALLEGRYRNEGRMRAGDYINGNVYTPGGVLAGPNPCTAGFGAEDEVPKPGGGGNFLRLFLLTAGHCYTKIDTEVWRAPQDESQEFDDAGKSEVGRLARNALQYAEASNVRTDGAAIRIKQGGIVPLAKWGWDGHALPTEPAGRARKGNTVCYSGAISKTVACGRIVARSLDWADTDEPYDLAGYWVRFPEDKRPKHGDSGSPVWNRYTGASIGLVSAGRPHDSLTETLVAPLLHPPNMPSNRVPGILHHVGMQPLQLKLGG